MTLEMEFERLRLASIEVADASYEDYRVVEPVYLEVLRLVLANPDSREFFVERFVAMATWTLASPGALVPFCMRELRFPEVLQAVRAHMDQLYAVQKHARYMNYCSDVVKAYSDFVWEDADMWDYFRAKELVPAVVPVLMKRLSIPDTETQFNALYALAALGSQAVEAQEVVRDFLSRQPDSSSLAKHARAVLEAIKGG